MIFDNLNGLKSALEANCRVLGLDVGSKTIGLALSDVTLMIASPLETIQRGKFSNDLGILKNIIEEHDVGALILGLPVSMDGTEGPRCQSTRQFAANVGNAIDISIGYWDERLSTVAVERILVEDVDMTRKRRSEVIDKAAAAYILQGALDYLKNR
ncbi:MAG: Holliday junction resolvase RuvX [Rhodospirillaceae bacterium]|jgi:putative Holliday junction resolvase